MSGEDREESSYMLGDSSSDPQFSYTCLLKVGGVYIDSNGQMSWALLLATRMVIRLNTCTGVPRHTTHTRRW